MKKRNLKNTHLVKLVGFIAFLFLTQNLIQAQVITRVLEDDEKIENYIPWYFLQSPDTKFVPEIDVQAVLQQDEIEGRELPRLGIKQEVNLSTSDGEFYQFGNYQVWKLKIYSEEAKTISFKLTETNLPFGSKMFIYNPETKFVVGPISPNNLHEGTFNSDILEGDYAIIEVFLPDETYQMLSLKVKDITHGVVSFEKSFDDDFGEAGDCNVNVACPEGNGLENEIAAVCKIIHSCIGSCSGALINNECNDLTPFILTAEHCICEGNLDDYIFRFNYQSPTCPEDPDGFEPHPNLWITFSGATLRASWDVSDFGLLELNSPIIGNDIAFAGWNRDDEPPISTPTVIHHPAGDIKKISIDGTPPESQENDWFVDDWDTGTTQGGSSGAPLFDDNNLIVGINSRGDGFPACDPEKGTFFGKFDISWDGDGTNDTRLSNWLGGVDNPNTVNSLLIPSISGGDILCTSNKNYVLQNPIPGYEVSWSVSPTSLFGSLTSGDGVLAILAAANSSSQGTATLTYTLTNADCGTQTFTKNIWVGKPLLTGIRTPKCFTPESNVSIRAQVQGASSFAWSFPNCPNDTPIGDPDPDCWFNYTGNLQQIFVYVGQQNGSISVWASNECGTSSINVPIEFCDDDKSGEGPIIRSSSANSSNENITEENKKVDDKITLFPNPANDFFTVLLNSQYYPQNTEKKIQLISVNGKLLLQKETLGNNLQVNISSYPTGIYYLRIQYKDEISFQKIIIL